MQGVVWLWPESGPTAHAEAAEQPAYNTPVRVTHTACSTVALCSFAVNPSLSSMHPVLACSV